MKIAIIGCGSLGRVLLSSLQKRKAIPLCGTLQRQDQDSVYYATAKSENSVRLLRERYGVNATQNNSEVAHSDQIFLCVKPTQAKEVCKSILDHLNPSAVVVSAMAAVPLKKIQEWLNHERVVKIMPTVLDGPCTIYNPGSYYVRLPTDNLIATRTEEELDLSTAVSGCFPGLLAYVLEQWIEGAVNNGMDREVAERLILGNLKSMGDSGLRSLYELRELRTQVTSKGGATERGIISLDKNQIWRILEESISAADSRVLELRRSLEEE